MGSFIVIAITKEATAKISDVIAEENNQNLKLRLYVQGGGCSGFQYGFLLEEQVNEDDMEFKSDSITLIVDCMSYQYLEGSTVDYKDELYGSSFTIKNPNAETTCGCGSSFSM
jgi:iron-sulfur cluster insertion protein